MAALTDLFLVFMLIASHVVAAALVVRVSPRPDADTHLVKPARPAKPAKRPDAE